MTIISSEEYCRLALIPDSASNSIVGHGYSALPQELLLAETTVAKQDELAAVALNKILCRSMLEQFTLDESPWTFPESYQLLYKEQLQRIEDQLNCKADGYFSFKNDPFRKDLGILRHRLIPCGAEFVTPYSGLSRALLVKGGGWQAWKFIRVMIQCRGINPFLELHMHPLFTSSFNPEGWINTYENLADFLLLNPSLLGVQSTSWFLDPALEQVSPHLVYLRQIPERCGATILYAGEDYGDNSGAFATSQTRRDLHAAGQYYPKLFTRIWPRQKILNRSWRALG